jgi:hypothetical protein
VSHVSNQEYMERWENSAPTPVDSHMTPEQIQAAQGTRLSNVAPWETYGQEMNLEDPAMLAAIEEYASRVSDADGSSQTKEELCRLSEANEANARQYQFVTPEEYADAKERIGKIKHSSRFLVELRKAGVKCWYRDHPQADKLTMVVQNKDAKPEVGCWVQRGFMPELSIMRFDEHGIPVNEKFRGWRTCLLQLLLKNILTEEEAAKIFGRPKFSPAFSRYHLILRSFRNQGKRLDN